MKYAVQHPRSWWGLAAAMALLFSSGGLAQDRQQGGEADSPEAIHLQSGSFTPEPGVEPGLREAMGKARRPLVGLVQLDDVPDEALRARLDHAGVELLEYVPNNTWIARLPLDVDQVRAVAGVRWVGRLLAEDKIAPGLVRTLEEKREQRELLLEVEVFSGTLEKAAGQVEALGGRVLARDAALSVLQILLPHEAVERLASSDTVLWISPEPPKALFNNRSRADARANQVQAAPYGLSGAGVQLGLWDGGEIFAHNDFTGRLFRIERGEFLVNGIRHATHVAGTMAGSGVRSSGAYTGFAPQAQIISYIIDNAVAPFSEHFDAIINRGIDNSQNSWGFEIRDAHGNCDDFGLYETYAREYDRIVTGAYGRRIPVVFSVGNDREPPVGGNCGLSRVPPFLNYSVVPPPATAKNVISVGAINGDNDAMTSFSSWGPTDDGRLKPDLVAAGCNAFASPEPAIYSTAIDNGYTSACGTSMAAPAVSGSIGLLLQRYRAVCPATGTDPLPSTVKALLIHSARDLDNSTSYLNRGPDYASGYGSLDIQAAIDILPFHRVDQVSQGEVDTFQIAVTRQSDLKVTIAWDDPAAVANSATALVNNLDLELVAPNGTTIHYPWVLSPSSPASNATRGTDNRNVVEQVVVNSVDASNAGVWTIRVIGRNVPSGPQRYSLVSQHLRKADLSCAGAPVGDVWIMDKDAPLSPLDTGAEPNPDTGDMWISNQIWVRNAEDNGRVHQNPEAGQPNYIYARIRNRGTTKLNTVRVMVYVAKASTGLDWPRAWTLLGEQTVVNLAAGAAATIQPVRWTPTETGHFCLYVRLLSDQDPITFAEGAGVYENTRKNNEIAWRNVNIVNLIPNLSAAKGGTGQGSGTADLRIANTVAGNASLKIGFDMLPDSNGLTLFDFATVEITLGDELLQHVIQQEIDLGTDGLVKLDERTYQITGPTASFNPILVSGRQEFPLSLSIRSLGQTAPSPLYTLDIHQNFERVSGSKPAFAGPALEVFDPADPNVGGIRYEIPMPSGTGPGWTGTIYGMVYDSQGAALPGVTVTLDGQGAPQVQVANAQGQFRFLGLAPGTWGLRAELEGFTSDSALAIVTAGRNTLVNFELTAPEEEE